MFAKLRGSQLRPLINLSKANWRFLSTSGPHDHLHGGGKFHSDQDQVPVPDRVLAKCMPRKFREIPNETVFNLSMHGVHGACRERLVREIMRVDDIDWKDARDRVEEMNRENDRYGGVAKIPYQVGLYGAAVSGFGSLPLVFHKETVCWFAEHVVKMDPADIPVDEMNTFWSVGSFSWGWMEPLLGTLSFVLLAAQFMRANMQKNGNVTIHG
mmetsp:Transcript_15768/g.24649  ORF Transcript_15768/g.24649 Transcript_15768/m.24649 type:complete len:212 (+) Transcript_15768:102-737(+)